MSKTKEVEVEVVPVASPKFFFQPDDGRTKFLKDYMVPGAGVIPLEDAIQRPHGRVRLRNLMKVQFIGQNHYDLVSPDFIKRRKKIVDEDGNSLLI